jgi:serine protease
VALTATETVTVTEAAAEAVALTATGTVTVTEAAAGTVALTATGTVTVTEAAAEAVALTATGALEMGVRGVHVQGWWPPGTLRECRIAIVIVAGLPPSRGHGRDDYARGPREMQPKKETHMGALVRGPADGSARGPEREPWRGRRRGAHGVALAALGASALTIAAALGATTTMTRAATTTTTPTTARAQARAASGSDRRGEYAEGEVVVKYAAKTSAGMWARTARAAGAEDPGVVAEHTRLLKLARGVSVQAALRRLSGQRDVVWAVPDYRARIAQAGGLIPNDTGIPGEGGAPGDWRLVQWNFVGQFGVDAPEAWANVASEGAPGGRGVIVAVLDTGVAYANRGRFRRSPDFGRWTFVKGYDFVDHSPYPNDENGHGTFVAGTIAEATNNGFGLTGLAFAARIMPVRVLNSEGEGDASTIAEGVRFAVRHGARVINLSLEFSPGVSASDIPELMEALRFAYRRGVVVVAAPHVIAVGATTEHGCLANYSNDGPGLTLVAPGGGADADLPGDPNCRPEEPSGRDVFQMTFTGSSPRVFGFPNGYEGTSMATPHVAATVALIIAGHVLGRRPTVAQITARLRATARKLGGPDDSYLYGAGLLDAAAATAPGGPGAR